MKLYNKIYERSFENLFHKTLVSLRGFGVISELFQKNKCSWPSWERVKSLTLIKLCVEVVRYSFYALHILGSVPTGLLWCRYSFFILLYPLGASGELFIIWRALPEVSSPFSFFIPFSLFLSIIID